MATSQPLVCASLHLPPDTQSFQRIYEISWHVFAPNLDRLWLAVEKFRDVNPEAIKILNETRITLREELLKAFKVLLAARELARRYLVLLGNVEAKVPTYDAVSDVNMGAEMAMRRSNEAKQAFLAIRTELEKMIDRVTAVTGTRHRKSSKFSLTSSQNAELVSEIYSAINECNGILQQCHSQFKRLLKQTRNEHSVDADPPSVEETKLMGAKWQTFLDTIDRLRLYSHNIADGVLYESSDGRKTTKGSRKRRQNGPSWWAFFQCENKQRSARSQNDLDGPSEVTVWFQQRALRLGRINTSSPRDVSERPDASDDAPVSNAPPSKGPFWRKILRWATCVSTTPF